MMELRPDIIIVVDKKAEVEFELATKLKNLIGATGKYRAVLWGLKEYSDNEPKLTSSQKIIFLGINSVSRRNESSIAQWKFQWNNLRYGWIGNTAIITMTEHKNYSDAEFKKFQAMCESHKMKVSNETIADVMLGSLEGKIAAAIVLPITLINLGISAVGEAYQSRENQYTFLVNEFMLNGFSEYLNQGTNS